MAGNIKGLTVEIGGDTSKLSQELTKLNKPIYAMQGELKRVSQLLKMNPGNTALIRQKMELLSASVEETEGKLKELRAAMQRASKAEMTEKNSAGFRRLQREIVETEARLKELTAEQARFAVQSSKIGIAAAKMGQLGQKATELGNRMRGASIAIGLVGGMAVRTTAEFDSAMSKVRAVSGATSQEFDQLRNKAREMGAKTKFSASEAAEAMNYMAMAGWKTKDMLSGIDGIMNLAAASGEDLATTSDIVTDGLTAMGYSAKDAGRMADVMAAASSNANTNVSMMGETFKYAAAVAGAMGYSMEDVALATSLMANAGIKGSQAGTSLRSMMSRMAAPTKQVSAAMKSIGVEMTNADGTARPFRDVLVDLRKGMAGLSETEKTQIASTIAGKNAMSGFLAIVNSSDQDFNKLADAIDNSDGAALKMAETMQENLGGQVTILKSQLQEMAIAAGDTLVPMVKKAVSATQALADWFNGLSDNSKRVVVMITLIVGAMGPMMLAFGAMASLVQGSVNAYANLYAAMKNLAKAEQVLAAKNRMLAISTMVAGKAQSAFSKLLGLGPWKLTAIGIGIAAAAFAVFLATNDEARAKVAQAFDTIKTKASTALNALPGIISSLASSIASTLPEIAEKAKEIIPKIADALANGMPQMLQAGVDTVLALIDGFTKALPGMIQAGTDILIGFINGLTAQLPTIINAGVSILNGLVNGIAINLPKIVQAAVLIIQGLITAITQNMPKIIAAAVLLITALAEGIIKCIPILIAAAPKILIALVQAVIQMAPLMLSAGKQIIQSLLSGIRSVFSSILSAITSLGSNIRNKAASVNLLAIGGKIIRTLLSGILGAVGSVISGIASIGSRIKSKISGVSLTSIGKNMIRGLANGMQSMLGTVSSIASKIAAKAAQAIKDKAKIKSPSRVWRDEIGLFLPLGLAAGMEKGIPKVQQAASAMMSAAQAGSTVTASGMEMQSMNAMKANVSTSFDYAQIYGAMAAAVNQMEFKIILDQRELGRGMRGMGVSFE